MDNSDQTITIDWLVKIGFTFIRQENSESIVGIWGEKENDWRIVYSTLTGWEIFGQYCPVDILTQNDVLQWLNVLKLPEKT